MGVEFLYKNDDFTVYVDEYSEENTVLRGRKEGSTQDFLILPKS